MTKLVMPLPNFDQKVFNTAPVMLILRFVIGNIYINSGDIVEIGNWVGLKTGHSFYRAETGTHEVKATSIFLSNLRFLALFVSQNPTYRLRYFIMAVGWMSLKFASVQLPICLASILVTRYAWRSSGFQMQVVLAPNP